MGLGRGRGDGDEEEEPAFAGGVGRERDALGAGVADDERDGADLFGVGVREGDVLEDLGGVDLLPFEDLGDEGVQVGDGSLVGQRLAEGADDGLGRVAAQVHDEVGRGQQA